MPKAVNTRKNSLLETAQILLDEGDYGFALMAALNAIRENCYDSHAYCVGAQISLYMAQDYMLQKRNNEARHYFRTAISGIKKSLHYAEKSCENDMAPIYATAGQIFYAVGRKDKAIPFLDKALALKPEHPIANFYKGLIVAKENSDKKVSHFIIAYKELNPPRNKHEQRMVQDCLRL